MGITSLESDTAGPLGPCGQIVLLIGYNKWTPMQHSN